MNKVILGGFVIACFASCVYGAATNKLYKAVETLNPEAVTRELRRLVPLAAKTKTELIGIAQDACDEAERYVTIKKSRRDWARLGSGSCLALLGLYGLLTLENWNRSQPEAVLCSFVAAAGMYLGYTGYRNSSAQGDLARAQQVMKIIEKTPIKSEDVKA